METPAWSKVLLGIFASLVTASIIAGASTGSEHGERIARVEAQVMGLREGQARIEKKLDKLLDMRSAYLRRHGE